LVLQYVGPIKLFLRSRSSAESNGGRDEVRRVVVVIDVPLVVVAFRHIEAECDRPENGFNIQNVKSSENVKGQFVESWSKVVYHPNLTLTVLIFSVISGFPVLTLSGVYHLTHFRAILFFLFKL
jgi:hypothetical protein